MTITTAAPPPATAKTEAVISAAGALIKVIDERRNSCANCCFAVDTGNSKPLCVKPAFLACTDWHKFRFAESSLTP